MHVAASEESFRLLVKSVKDYAIFMLDPAGRVASWNEGARRIKGYEASEIIGQHFSKFYRPEDVATGLCDHELEIARRDGRFEDDGWRLRKDGSLFWANVVITALRNPRGELVGFGKVTRDMSDRSYRTFIQATHALMWTCDPTGLPIADSPTWRAFTGQSDETWRSARAFDPIRAADRATLAAAFREPNRFEMEACVKRHDGASRWVCIRGVPIFNTGNTLREWFCAGIDITDQKTAEMERERARVELQTTLTSIGDAVIVTNARGEVTFMNPIAERLTHWRTEQARGKPLHEVFPIVNAETRQGVENPVDRVLREGVIVGMANHTVLVRSDGTDLPIDDSAAPIRGATGELFGVVMVFRDASAEKRASDRRAFLLRAGEVLMASSDHHDALQSVARLTIPRFADMCVVSLAESGGVSTSWVAHVDSAKEADVRALAAIALVRNERPELRRDVDRAFIEAIATSPQHERALARLALRSLIVVPLQGRARTLGTIVFAYGDSNRRYDDDDLHFVEDLARRAGLLIERRQLERERADLLERAESANRAKDEFLATLSHELRNPLTTIVGWPKMLVRSDLPEKYRTQVKAIERNATAQSRLIEDMLDLSRIMSGKLRLEMTQTNVTQVIADAIEAQRRAASAKAVTIATKIDEKLETLADPIRLQQIVTNLVSNAVKFTAEGGTVSVTGTRRDGRVEITVSDTGEGIDPKRLAAIFEPFKQEDASTTRRHGGLGLGLAIVRALVAAHGGVVRARSDGKGKGASFVVELPLQAPNAAALASEPPAAVPSLAGLRVLVVDDEPDLVELITAMLESAGARAEGAPAADVAVAMVRALEPHVIVSDIGMPKVDGYELLRRVRALRASEGGTTPAIALTAYAHADDAERAHAAGFQRHLSKPVDPVALITAVADVARRRS